MLGAEDDCPVGATRCRGANQMPLNSSRSVVIPDDLLRHLAKATEPEIKVMLALLRETSRTSPTDSVEISLGQLAIRTELSRSAVVAGINRAENAGRLIVHRDGYVNRYEVVLDENGE
jgi:DNA-binding transcriptional ArsR family regulator